MSHLDSSTEEPRGYIAMWFNKYARPWDMILKPGYTVSFCTDGDVPDVQAAQSEMLIRIQKVPLPFDPEDTVPWSAK